MIKLYIIIYIKEVFVLFIINSIWEYFINFMEQVLFIIFVHTKLHKKANFKNQSFLMLLFLTIQFIVLCFMNQEEISSYITSYIQYRTITQNDNSLPSGTTKVLQSGSNGCRSVCYRILKQNGEVISKTLLSYDTYSPHNKVVAVGTKAD